MKDCFGVLIEALRLGIEVGFTGVFATEVAAGRTEGMEANLAGKLTERLNAFFFAVFGDSD
ncbi:hypothetical protein GZ77_14985 [Endozoicomonas montiporae]|uniref:Uncharacterized protein n=2 Tax=Endozoicomonas montiporae TaxID=1027273 RepID=A0A081N594_9GAMM|nr:hypothetical protein GZ77_14985 [Endozoicomonas montiporae]